MHFILGREQEKTKPPSCFSCPVLRHSLPSPELQAHTCEQAISARHTHAVPYGSEEE